MTTTRIEEKRKLDKLDKDLKMVEDEGSESLQKFVDAIKEERGKLTSHYMDMRHQTDAKVKNLPKEDQKRDRQVKSAAEHLLNKLTQLEQKAELKLRKRIEQEKHDLETNTSVQYADVNTILQEINPEAYFVDLETEMSNAKSAGYDALHRFSGVITRLRKKLEPRYKHKKSTKVTPLKLVPAVPVVPVKSDVLVISGDHDHSPRSFADVVAKNENYVDQGASPPSPRQSDQSIVTQLSPINRESYITQYPTPQEALCHQDSWEGTCQLTDLDEAGLKQAAQDAKRVTRERYGQPGLGERELKENQQDMDMVRNRNQRSRPESGSDTSSVTEKVASAIPDVITDAADKMGKVPEYVGEKLTQAKESVVEQLPSSQDLTHVKDVIGEQASHAKDLLAGPAESFAHQVMNAPFVAKDMLVDSADSLAHQVMNAPHVAKEKAMDAGEYVYDAGLHFFERIVAMEQSIQHMLLNWVGIVSDAAVQVTDVAASGLVYAKDAAVDQGQAVLETTADTLDGAKQAAVQVGHNISETAFEKGQAVLDTSANTLEGAKQATSQVSHTIQDTIGQTYDKAASAAGTGIDVAENVAAKGGNLLSSAYEKGKEIVSGSVELVSGGVERVKHTIGDALPTGLQKTDESTDMHRTEQSGHSVKKELDRQFQTIKPVEEHRTWPQTQNQFQNVEYNQQFQWPRAPSPIVNEERQFQKVQPTEVIRTQVVEPVQVVKPKEVIQIQTFEPVQQATNIGKMHECERECGHGVAECECECVPGGKCAKEALIVKEPGSNVREFKEHIQALEHAKSNGREALMEFIEIIRDELILLQKKCHQIEEKKMTASERQNASGHDCSSERCRENISKLKRMEQEANRALVQLKCDHSGKSR